MFEFWAFDFPLDSKKERKKKKVEGRPLIVGEGKNAGPGKPTSCHPLGAGQDWATGLSGSWAERSEQERKRDGTQPDTRQHRLCRLVRVWWGNLLKFLLALNMQLLAQGGQLLLCPSCRCSSCFWVGLQYLSRLVERGACEMLAIWLGFPG